VPDAVLVADGHRGARLYRSIPRRPIVPGSADVRRAVSHVADAAAVRPGGLGSGADRRKSLLRDARRAAGTASLFRYPRGVAKHTKPVLVERDTGGPAGLGHPDAQQLRLFGRLADVRGLRTLAIDARESRPAPDVLARGAPPGHRGRRRANRDGCDGV